MTDPLSIAAGVITVASVAYSSTKNLYEFIQAIKGAPKTLEDTNADLAALQQVLNSLEEELKDKPDTELPDGLKKLLEDVKPALEECTKTCNEFRAKLAKVTSHTTEDHTSKRDMIKLHFQDKEILAFKYRIASLKATLSLALESASLYVSIHHGYLLTVLITKSNLANQPLKTTKHSKTSPPRSN
jgi:hypothetical protein